MASNRLVREGFEGGSTTELGSIGWYAVNKAPTIESTVVRKDPAGNGGSYSLRLEGANANTTGGWYTKAFTPGATRYLKFAMTDGGSSPQIRVGWSAPSGTQLGYAEFNSTTGYISVYTGASGWGTGTGTLRATGTVAAHQTGRWELIEIIVTISDAGGVITVYVNGTQAVTWTGDTKPGADTTIDRFFWTTHYSLSGYNYIDDVVVDANELPGDGYIYPIYPTGNGNSSQLTGSDGDSTDNYALVDEVVASDTDYVEAASADLRDTYAMGNLPASAALVKGIRWVVRGVKSGSTVQNIQPVLRLDGADNDGSSIALPTSYGVVEALYDARPDTAAAFSVAAVNGLESGYELVA